MRDLKTLLGAIQKAGLMVNPRKCHLGQRETRYLGFLVGQGHVKPVLDKVEALQNCMAPKTKRQIRSFLGLANYYRKCILHFSEMVVLVYLVKSTQGTEVWWIREAQKAFETVKRSLCGEPVLFTLEFNKLFFLEINASAVALRAVLTHKV